MQKLAYSETWGKAGWGLQTGKIVNMKYSCRKRQINQPLDQNLVDLWF